MSGRGSGVEEIGVEKATGKTLVKVNPQFFRPAEVELLLGDPAKAEEALDWQRQIPFAELVSRMVDHDLALVQREIKVNSLKD